MRKLIVFIIFLVWINPADSDGPSQVSLSLHDNSGAVTKCAADASFSAYCEVAKDDANPTPTITLTADDDSTIVSKGTSVVNNNYRKTYTVTPVKGRVLTMTCLATNPSVSLVKTEESKHIRVLAPPPSRPVMTVEGRPPVPNGGVVTVINGDEVKVNCRADGGYPPVKKIITTCGGLVNVKDGASEETQTFYAWKEYNNKKCTCKGEYEYELGCGYNDESEFTLNVIYTPTITSFETIEKSTELTVWADYEVVAFVCETEGNPIPSVSVKGQRWEGIVTLRDTLSGSYGRKSWGTKRMTCQDTDLYTCTAHNGVGCAGTTRTVSIFVRCVPEFPPGSDSSIQEYSYLNGRDMEIQIPIIGYPPPRDFFLTKITNTRRRKRATEEEEIPKQMYITTYEAGPAPKGTVVLTLIGFTSGYSGQYALKINNGIGQGLDYTFNVTIVAGEWPGHKTNSSNSTSSSRSEGGEEDSLVPVIAGVVVTLIVIVVVIVVVIFVLRKKGAQGEENAATATAAISSLPPSNPHNLVSSKGVYEDCDMSDEVDSELPVEPTVTPPVNQGVNENNPSPPSTTSV